MNLNTLAKEITLKEGLKKSLSIAQVKEVIKLVLAKIGYVNKKDSKKSTRIVSKTKVSGGGYGKKDKKGKALKSGRVH